jgi:hypothetical protein
VRDPLRYAGACIERSTAVRCRGSILYQDSVRYRGIYASIEDCLDQFGIILQNTLRIPLPFNVTVHEAQQHLQEVLLKTPYRIVIQPLDNQ